MAKIAVDLDSTLYDFETPAREAFQKLALERDDKSLFVGAYQPLTEWRSFTDACGIEVLLDVIAEVHKPEVIMQQEPFSGAVETCQALIDAGHELIYISNRQSECEDATRRWLFKWGFLDAPQDQIPEVVCVPDGGPKTFWLQDCQYLIDDRPKTVVEFVTDQIWWHENAGARQRKAFVKAYSYNQNLTDIPDLYLAPTWSGLNYYLASKGVLPEPAVTPILKV